MHISSLPSEYGIGKMGKQAFDFVDFLVSSETKCWQMLPLFSHKLRRFAVPVLLRKCRKSLLYRL